MRSQRRVSLCDAATEDGCADLFAHSTDSLDPKAEIMENVLNILRGKELFHTVSIAHESFHSTPTVTSSHEDSEEDDVPYPGPGDFPLGDSGIPYPSFSRNPPPGLSQAWRCDIAKGHRGMAEFHQDRGTHFGTASAFLEPHLRAAGPHPWQGRCSGTTLMHTRETLSMTEALSGPPLPQPMPPQPPLDAAARLLISSHGYDPTPVSPPAASIPVAVSFAGLPSQPQQPHRQQQQQQKCSKPPMLLWCASNPAHEEAMHLLAQDFRHQRLLHFVTSVKFMRWLFEQHRGCISPWCILVVGWREAKPCLAALQAAASGDVSRLRPDGRRPKLRPVWEGRRGRAGVAAAAPAEVGAADGGLEDVGAAPNIAVAALVVTLDVPEMQEARATTWIEGIRGVVPGLELHTVKGGADSPELAATLRELRAGFCAPMQPCEEPRVTRMSV